MLLQREFKVFKIYIKKIIPRCSHLRRIIFNGVSHTTEDYSMLHPTPQRIIPHLIPNCRIKGDFSMTRIIPECGIQRGIIFRCLSHTMKDYSAVYHKGKIIPRCIPQREKNIPLCIPQQGINLFVIYFCKFSKAIKMHKSHGLKEQFDENEVKNLV